MSFLSYDPITHSSLLMCKVLSGGNYQIKYNLRNLGFPILNDLKDGG